MKDAEGAWGKAVAVDRGKRVKTEITLNLLTTGLSSRCKALVSLRSNLSLAPVILLSGLLTACAGTGDTAQRELAQTRLAHAEAMFQERCKKSGEFIYRTVDNVEGVLLLKIREQNSGEQYKMDDPYGHDSWGDQYIKSFFLEPMLQTNKYANEETLARIQQEYRGYRYVDAIDPKDGKRYRYTGGMKVVGKQDATAYNIRLAMSKDPNYDLNIYSFVLDKTPASNPLPRYGVTYDDISTREERDYWIAGSSLKVIDLKTNEVIAERIGYMMDRGQGNTSGGRAPWLWAANYACPQFGTEKDRLSVPGATYQTYQTRKFVTKIIKPMQER